MFTIAQISDLHITSDADPEKKSRNEARLRAVLKAVHALQPRPVAIIASGDLADHGQPAEYAELAKILHQTQIPIHFGIGNHDVRANFRAAFPQTPVDEHGFVQYGVELNQIRLVMCDTLDEGREGGGFCERRAGWLGRTLDAEPHRPTIVALHHPPLATGIEWLDPAPDAEWIFRLGRVVDRHAQIRALVCGHVHRACHGIFAGHLLSISPASAPQLTLNMTQVNMHVPDGREIVLDEPPGFSLYRWDGSALTAHTCVAGDFPPVAFYETPFARA